ncbi:hypothetical protein Amet_2609 [Alkaliphilus metalliredigens QYMF]|uniref:Uncharacterized protein n=1 Tax=Alkaliphilus metalliredigens (strain QYMF) TaxID=293826 RepID=A6TRE3_ALKMQ|nr:hypothetical protein [Alkaliphilus metalliredigens]ABR48761.1 hypothetical protein Amet_2609 [Alkaliphilus metalliredigens QYMF]
MPRRKRKARKVDKPRAIKVKPNVRLIDIKKISDDISPGILVAVADYKRDA